MNQFKKKWQWLLFFLQGILIGTGAILPGISGGVLCVAFGIYEPMMAFLVHPLRTFRRSYKMFIALIAGGLVGFVLLAKVVEGFLSASLLIAMMLFAGLIGGTVPGLIKKSVASGPDKGWTGFTITLIASFLFFQLLDTGMQGNAITPNRAWFLFCGAVWGLSMVIPGLSSSSILLFMGLYQPMAEGIGNLDFSVLIPLVIGFAATIVLASRGVDQLLKHHYTGLSRVILGFVLSSVLMILPSSFTNVLDLALGAAVFAAGFLLAFWMDTVTFKQVPEEK